MVIVSDKSPSTLSGFEQRLLSRFKWGLLALIEQNAIPTLRYKFFMGYAGWSPGQLEGEIAKNMWVVGNPTPDLVFNTKPDEMWAKAVRVLGPDYAHWLNVPKYVNLN